MTIYYCYCLLDNSHEKPFHKTMDRVVRAKRVFDISCKNQMGKIENMTLTYVNITLLKTLIRNLVSKTCERKECNMMLVQVNI